MCKGIASSSSIERVSNLPLGYSDLAPAFRLYVSLKPGAPIRGRAHSAASCLVCHWRSRTDNPYKSVRWNRGTRRLCAPESACCSQGSRGKARRRRWAPTMSACTASLCLSEAGGCMDGKRQRTASGRGSTSWRKLVALVRSCRRGSQHTPGLGTKDEGRLGANRAPRIDWQRGHPRSHG